MYLFSRSFKFCNTQPAWGPHVPRHFLQTFKIFLYFVEFFERRCIRKSSIFNPWLLYNLSLRDWTKELWSFTIRVSKCIFAQSHSPEDLDRCSNFSRPGFYALVPVGGSTSGAVFYFICNSFRYFYPAILEQPRYSCRPLIAATSIRSG